MTCKCCYGDGHAGRCCPGWLHAADGEIEACDDCGRFTVNGRSDDDAARIAHDAECGCDWNKPDLGPVVCSECGRLIPTDDPNTAFCDADCEAAWKEHGES